MGLPAQFLRLTNLKLLGGGDYEKSIRTERASVRGKDRIIHFISFDVPVSASTAAIGVNNIGAIVGKYRDQGGTTHGFLLRYGAFTTIDYPDGVFTSAQGITGQGWIVGRFDDQDGVQHAFLLKNGQFEQLDFPGSTGTVAHRINDRGEIVGRYVDADSHTHGFVLGDGRRGHLLFRI